MRRDNRLVLAFDIGNSRSTIAAFRNDVLVTRWTMPSANRFRSKPMSATMDLLLREASALPTDVRGLVISSVVPAKTGPLLPFLRDRFRCRILRVSANLELGLTLRYKNPRLLGPDRICGAVSAYHLFGGPAIVIDFGTATTFGVISRKGEFLGGLIAPGIETSAGALTGRTALLPGVPLDFPAGILGTDPVLSMQSGIFYSALAAAEGIIRRLKKIVGSRAVTIATGGFAPSIVPHTSFIRYHVPDLVLYGAYLVWKRNSSDSPAH